jgi:hypothetical protein
MAGIQKAQAGYVGTSQGSSQLPFYRVLWAQI